MSNHAPARSLLALLAIWWIVPLGLGGHLAEAQTWARTYDNTSGAGRSDGEAKTIRHTSDGGYFFFDTVGDYTAFTGYDFRLTKLDAMGSVEWSSLFLSPYFPDPGEALQTADGGYLFTGTFINESSPPNPIDPCIGRNLGLIKVNPDGTIQWQHSYGLEAFRSGSCYPNNEHGRALAESGDGGYLVLGYRDIPPGPNVPPDQESQGQDLWLIKVDADGNLLWQKSYGGAGNELIGLQPNLLAVLDNGDIVISGGTYSYGSAGRQYVLVVRLDSTGTIQWERAVGTSVDNTWPKSLVATGDSVLMVMDTSAFDPTSPNIWLIKFASSGVIEWQEILTDSSSGVSAGRAQQTADGGYILFGHRGSFPLGSAPLLLKVTPTGAPDWILKFGVGGTGQSGDLTSDGGFVLGGYSRLLRDVLLLRTDENGVINADYCDILEAPPVFEIMTSEPPILTALTTTVTTSPQWDESLTRSVGTEVEDFVCSPPPEPVIHTADNPLRFGNVPVGSSSTLTQHVENIGSADLFISAVSSPSGPLMTMDIDGCSGFILPPGVSCPLQLTFSPIAEGSFADQLSISSDDPNTPSLTVVLQGFGGASGIFADNFEIGSPSGWSDAVP